MQIKDNLIGRATEYALKPKWRATHRTFGMHHNKPCFSSPCDFLVRAKLASVFQEHLSNAICNHSCRHELRKVLEIFSAGSF